MANALLDLVPVIYPVEVEGMRRAIDLFQTYGPKGVTPRDTVHAAVILNRKIKEIISTDSHFDLIEGITRLDPETLYHNRGKNRHRCCFLHRTTCGPQSDDSESEAHGLASRAGEVAAHRPCDLQKQ